jgi:hypothetical protein
MLKRLLAALLEGALPGAVVAYALSKLGMEAAVTMYAAVALVGVVTGLVAGRPIWAKAAKTEAALKATAGAFISVVVLYALRKWLPSVHVDLGALGAGAIGNVPWAFLPAVGVALALVLEIDDAFGADRPAPPRVRAATEASLPSAAPALGSEEDEEANVAQARRGG